MFSRELPHRASARSAPNTMRSVLTTLGIVIGVAAVIAVVSIVQGLQCMIIEPAREPGRHLHPGLPAPVVLRSRVSRRAPGQADLGGRPGDPAIRCAASSCITPLIFGHEEVKFRDRQHRTDACSASTPNGPTSTTSGVDRGRFFSHLDLDRRSKVAVVGHDVVDELRMPDPIGKEIYVGTTPVTVIGVMESKGESLGRDFDDLVFIPFDARAHASSAASVGDQVQLQLQADEQRAWWTRCKDGIERVLRQRHHIGKDDQDDFRVVVQDEILQGVLARPRRRHRGGGRRRRHRPAGRRHRHHEHHAGLGDRAHARDRRAQGGRRAAAGHPDPVPDRGGGAVACVGGAGRHRARLRRWARWWRTCSPAIFRRPTCRSGRWASPSVSRRWWASSSESTRRGRPRARPDRGAAVRVTSHSIRITIPSLPTTIGPE